jgi:hypothetical protein
MNIHHAETSQETNRWVLVGLANSLEEGCEKSKKLQNLLCDRNNKKPYGIEELLYNDK